MTIRRRVQSDYDLQDAADMLGLGLEDAARDVALLSVIASLAETFGTRVVYEGGAALRFAHGATRTSRDADATITDPPRTPIAPEQVAAAITRARMGQFLRYRIPTHPATANRYSLDLDRVGFVCAGIKGTLDVELSFREEVILQPLTAMIGGPYFEPFPVRTMRPVEMVAEKLRTLAQRQRGTDLADLVLLEQLALHELEHLPHLREEKFKLVRNGLGHDEILERIEALQPRYDTDVRAVDPDAPTYDTARDAALRLARAAWP